MTKRNATSRLPTALCVLAATALATAPATALPDGLPEVPLRIIFVTSSTTDGDIGGLPGADAFVTAAANNPGSLIAGIPVKAILSVMDIDAPTNFVDGGEPIYNTNGQLVATSLGAMYAPGGVDLVNAIGYDESGAAVDALVWTGTDDDGTLAAASCGGFFDSNDSGLSGNVGQSEGIDEFWTDEATLNCANPAHLYGLTEVVTPGAEEEPEPVPMLPSVASALLVVSVVAAGWLTVRRRPA